MSSEESLGASVHPKSNDGTFPSNDMIYDIPHHLLPIIHRNYPITDFVRNIWHYKATIPPGNYSLPIQYVKGDCVADGDDQHLKHESSFWLNKILTHLHDILPENPSNAGTFVDIKGRATKGLYYVKLKPDISYTRGDNEKSWDMVGAFVQTRISRSMTAFNLGDAKAQVLSIDVSRITSSEARFLTSPLYQKALTHSLQINDDILPVRFNALKRKLSMSSVVEGKVIPKRPRGEKWEISNAALSSQDIVTSQSNTCNTAATDSICNNVGEHSFTDYEVEAIKYANKLISHGVRNYSTGILFDDANVSFWYIDRMAVIKSKPFNFIKSPHYLLLAIAAMKAATVAQLGVCPFLDYSADGAQFGQYNNVYLQLPHAVDERGDDITDTTQLRFPLDVDPPRRHILPTYGAIGRGTTVIPLKAVPKSGTVPDDEIELIAKISWPAERRKAEDNHIRVIRKKLSEHPEGKEYVKNIARVKFSLSLQRDDEDLSFPRNCEAMMFDEQSEPRVFRLLVMVCYEPLQNVRNPEEFKKIFRELVTAHHYVFTVAEILHRDISPTNLMFHRINGIAVGILSDWDLAVGASKEEQEEEARQLRGIDVDGASKNEPPSNSKLVASMEAEPAVRPPLSDDKWKDMRFKTGTAPFMALDLLKPGPAPVHIYRYDLESFFYVLVWFCATFNPETHKMNVIARWQNSSDDVILIKKRAFFENDGEYASILKPTHKHYQPLIDEWILPLREIFMKIFTLSNEITTLKVAIAGRKRSANNIVLKGKGIVLDDPEELEEKRDRYASFATFMRQLED
ncbi:hypothetical protein C8Q75DRAFT_734980 [Abortiporus biennis]|nr:hypothetical protein C8Q75DRAFT_734980 [Abortiporus biennis]